MVLHCLNHDVVLQFWMGHLQQLHLQAWHISKQRMEGSQACLGCCNQVMAGHAQSAVGRQRQAPASAVLRQCQGVARPHHPQSRWRCPQSRPACPGRLPASCRPDLLRQHRHHPGRQSGCAQLLSGLLGTLRDRCISVASSLSRWGRPGRPLQSTLCLVVRERQACVPKQLKKVLAPTC